MYKLNVILLIGLVSTCLITSCSKPINEAVVGKWQLVEQSEFIEFFADHTFVMTIVSTESTSGKWSKIAGDRFKLDMVVSGEPRIVTLDNVSIVGDEMKVTIDGKEGTASRVKYGSHDTGGNAGFPSVRENSTRNEVPNSAVASAGKRNAQNLASVSSAAAAAGATKAQLGTDLRSAIANLSNGITVTSNGQVMGPFKVDGLPDDLSQTTSNLTFDQDTGIIRYTPSTDQIGTFTPNSQQAAISAGKRNAQNLASVSSAACAAGATKAQLGTDLRSAIATLTKGVNVTNNGQVMGPFRVDGLPDDLSLVTRNLTFDQQTGVIRYTPSKD